MLGMCHNILNKLHQACDTITFLFTKKNYVTTHYDILARRPNATVHWAWDAKC